MEKGSGTENYYDILDVKSDCSDKDIKNAYVKLSKVFHPDVKGVKTDQQQTARFLKISEAYQTLSKPKLRSEYDQNLLAAQSMRVYGTGNSIRTEVHRPWEIKPDYDPNPGPHYYGIKGLNKTTNSRIALALIVLGIFGGVFGFASVRQSFSLNRQKLDDISARANEHHQKIRSDAEKYGKEEQVRRVLDRISAAQAER